MTNFNNNSTPTSATTRFRSDSAFSGGMSAHSRVDANDVYLFQNELTMYDPKAYDVIKNELSWSTLFHTRTDINPGMEVYTYNMYDAFGESKFSANKAKDIPLVGSTGQQFNSPFGNIDVAMEFTAQDLKASAAARKDIISRLRGQAMRSNFEAINKACFEGYAPLKIQGLIGNSAFTGVTSAASAVVATRDTKILWANKTSENIFLDLMEGYNAALAATSNNIRPDTLIMSLTAYNDIATRIFNTFNGQTILQQIINMTNVKVRGLPELNGVFGTNKDKNGFIFFKNDPEYVEQLVPTLFDSTPPQQEGWTYTVYCRSRYGGIVIRQPRMFITRHGI